MFKYSFQEKLEAVLRVLDVKLNSTLAGIYSYSIILYDIQYLDSAVERGRYVKTSSR